MVRIHTAPHATEMIRHQSFWYCTNEVFIKEAVHPDVITPEAHKGIALLREATHPDPAAAFSNGFAES